MRELTIECFFTEEEIQDIVAASCEKGKSVVDFVRELVLDGLY